jgi:hypothetical protein
MDGSQFDTLLRGLTTARTRRDALIGILGGGLGLLSFSESEAKHHKKHKKKGRGSPPASPPPLPPTSPPSPQCPASCPVCQQCVDGRTCTVQPNATPCGDVACQECRGGVCVNVPDETPCQENGLCGRGTCNQPPNCISTDGTSCEIDADCCNGQCLSAGGPPTCNGRGGTGARCLIDDDCSSRNCLAFRCT